MLVKPTQPWNAPASIVVTCSGMVSTSKFLHSEKAEPFIVVTLDGMTIFFSWVQFSKAHHLISSKPSKRLTLVNAVQS